MFAVETVLSKSKPCNKCYVVKSLECFASYKNRKDRLCYTPCCKECILARARKRNAEIASDPILKKKMLEKIYAWRRKTGWNKKESVVASKNKWFKKFGRACRATWFKEHPEKRLLYSRAWRAKHNSQVREYCRRRRARVLNATIGEVSYDEILERDAYVCHVCGNMVAPWDLEFDHVIPLSRGGPHNMENIKISHMHCNRVKHAKITIIVEQ